MSPVVAVTLLLCTNAAVQPAGGQIVTQGGPFAALAPADFSATTRAPPSGQPQGLFYNSIPSLEGGPAVRLQKVPLPRRLCQEHPSCVHERGNCFHMSLVGPDTAHRMMLQSRTWRSCSSSSTPASFSSPTLMYAMRLRPVQPASTTARL